MYKVAAALLTTFTGLLLLLSFKSHPVGASRSALGTTSSPPAASERSPSATTSAGPTAGKGKAAKRARTYTGKPVTTQYGVVQVAAVVRAGKLADVRVLQHTDDGARSQQVNAAALPKLKSEALSAQKANIDVVSGATYTSTGYARSLQSALDKAGL